ncbi:MAG: beta-lactamase family protein, partial [Myxococcales bacterium]|nr:beta-lactamase family protein [Myxococcales bacterium]
MRIVSLALAMLALTACTAAPLREPVPVRSAALDRSVRVAASLRPVVRLKGAAEERHSIAQRMERYRTPGVSVAVVDGGKLVWASGFGVTERGKASAVTPATLFQAASISKAVTATATLRLAENKAFSLDEDVNHYLTSWQVPESEFTAAEKVTLRRLMSHTAGVGLHGFLGYASDDTLPTVAQILDGKPPANTPPIRVTAVPGSKLSYSGGGVLIEQLVLTDVTGKPFPDLMRELVLVPAGMRESTFEEPLSPAAARHAASAHDASGAPLRGRFFVYPEMAAAGLWSTPSDLVAWAMAIADARAGRPLAVLSQASAQAMLTPQKGPLGLGPIVRGEGRALRFGHSGWAEGAHAEVVYFPELGMGAAVMVNGASGRPLVREILYAIAAEYAWPGFEPDVVAPVEVETNTKEALVGTYGATVDGAHVDVVVRREGEELVLESKRLGVSSAILFVSGTSFIVRD